MRIKRPISKAELIKFFSKKDGWVVAYDDNRARYRNLEERGSGVWLAEYVAIIEKDQHNLNEHPFFICCKYLCNYEGRSVGILMDWFKIISK